MDKPICCKEGELSDSRMGVDGVVTNRRDPTGM